MFQPMDMPRTIVRHAIDPDKVVKGGKVVGCSTSRVYSAYLRKMISLCVIDRRLGEPGTEVAVVWGNKGGPQKEIRAVVTSVPFKPDQRRIDVDEALNRRTSSAKRKRCSGFAQLTHHAEEVRFTPTTRRSAR